MMKKMMENMMGKMMDEFFAGKTAEDEQKMMAEMMPKMMEGMNMMEMMKGMMGGEGGECMPAEGMEKMMPKMTEMMPKCLTMMLPKLPKEQRVEFALKMIATLVEQGTADMSEDEKKKFMEKAFGGVKV